MKRMNIFEKCSIWNRQYSFLYLHFIYSKTFFGSPFIGMMLQFNIKLIQNLSDVHKLDGVIGHVTNTVLLIKSIQRIHAIICETL